MGMGGQRYAPAALPPRKRRGTHCIGGWVGPSAVLGSGENLALHRDSIPGPSSPYRVGITTELPQPNALRVLHRGADKSLARPGRKQATVTKLLTFASHSKKLSEGCPSNQVSAAAMTSASDEKWRPFNCFFQSGRAKDLSAVL